MVRTIPKGYVEAFSGADVLYLETQASVLDQMFRRFPAVMQEAIAKAVEKTASGNFCVITISEKFGNEVPKEIRCPKYLLPDEAKFDIITSTQPTLMKYQDANGRRTIMENIFVVVSK